jgi:hypothetical protein
LKNPGTVGSLLWALAQSGMMAAAASDRVVEDLVIGYLAITQRGRGGKGT